ncbi:MAG: hypothetical protein F4X58_04460 [Chloroflexi bacterium]|nr:hypothetical protein [Chloroflexota bacterium]MYC01154.1 hypothetical protein [Chloroflexota bacterium]
MISGLLHLVTPQPSILNSRFQRLGIVNHLAEWHWHWKRIALVTVLLLGEAGGLYISYLERNWSAAAVASALLFYVVMSMILKEMPLFTETEVRRRRRVITRLWSDIPVPCYCQLRLRENVVFSGGIDPSSDDTDYVAKQVVAMCFLATPPGVATYRQGYGDFLDEEIDMIFSERSEEHRAQMKQAAERYYTQLAYQLDGAPARYRREH